MEAAVLLAVPPGARMRLASALRGHRLVWAETVDTVRAALARQSFDLIVVGAHFQESKPFEVLEYLAAARPAARIVCVRAVAPRGMLGKPAMRAFQAACEALGASLVIDLLEFPDRELRSLLVPPDPQQDRDQGPAR